MSNNKDVVFNEYQKFINVIDDRTEYGEISRQIIRDLLKQMNRNIERQVK